MIVSCFLTIKYNVIWLVCNISKQCEWSSGLDLIQRFYISCILMNVCSKYPNSRWIGSWCSCLLHQIMPNTCLSYVFGNNIGTFCYFICLQIIGFLSIWVSTIIYFIWAYKTTILVNNFKLYFSNYLWYCVLFVTFIGLLSWNWYSKFLRLAVTCVCVCVFSM